MQTLRETAIGKTVSVVKLHGEGAIKRRPVLSTGLKRWRA